MKTDERQWTIYMYTFPNEKKYIGKTSRTLKKRQGSSNWIDYKKSIILMRAVKKYGIENIKQDILFQGFMTDEYAARLEKMCILLFKSNCLKFEDPSYGYNMTDGGEGVSGYHHTSEAKRKMSEAKIGKSGENANGSKPIYCIELNTTFISAVVAEKYTGVSRKTISRCCLGKSKSTRGGNTEFKILHWIFEEHKTDDLINQIMLQPKINFTQNTSSGVNGVYWDNIRQKWAVQIQYNGTRYNLGRYLNKNDAIVARLSAESMYYGVSAPQYNLFEKYNI